MSPILVSGFFTTSTIWEAPLRLYHLLIIGSWPQRVAPPEGALRHLH